VREQMKTNVAAITESLDSARKSAQEQLGAASAASASRYASVVKAVEDGLEAARAHSDAKFSQVYIDMATDRQRHDEALSAAVTNLNEQIAKSTALEDERFSKTVKDLSAARAEARTAVEDATKQMKAEITATKAKAEEVETRRLADLQVVSAMIISDKAAQTKINNKITEEMTSLVNLSDQYHTANKNARGVIRKIMDENKAAAAEEVKLLATKTTQQLDDLKAHQDAHISGFKKDLEHATKDLYAKLSKDKEAQDAAMAELSGSLTTNKAAVAGALADAKTLFGSRVMSLTNAVTANQKYYKDKMEEKTGLVLDWKKASDQDRKDIRLVREAMVSNLHVEIEKAIAKGEAEMKAVQERALANVDESKKAMLTTISESVENMADNVFATVQGNRQKVADNYLSLKAYCATAADLIVDYTEKGKTKALSSVGDLLKTISMMEDVETTPTDGEGFGADSIPMIFSGATVKVDNSVSKINGLVNEYMKTVSQVKDRWPMGLGAYLIAKLEMAMQGTGALEVDKVAAKAGNYVFINAHAVGLSSKLSAFEQLAVRMTHYESTLAKLTGSLSTEQIAAKRNVVVSPPEWPGN